MLGLGLSLSNPSYVPVENVLTFEVLQSTGTGVNLFGTPGKADENIVCQVSISDSYTIGKLCNGQSAADYGLNTLVQGTFNMTLQRVSGTEGNYTVDDEATTTVYGYLSAAPANPPVRIIFSTSNSLTSSGNLGFDMYFDTVTGLNATNFGGSDISTTVEDDYRVKFTYTVDGKTSEEFTMETYPVDAFNA